MATILVIEDEEVLARNIAISLHRCGYQVHHSASAEQARELLSKHRYDLLIVDISLGDGDGIDVLQEYHPTMAHVPIVVITGQDSVLNRSRTNDIGLAVFLAKPFALARLRELVAALLEESAPGSLVRSESNPSVVMYSNDTIGLGHMRRNLAIARELVKLVPRLSVLLLVGCPAGMVFETEPGIDYVKLPSITKLGRNRYTPGSLRLDSSTTKAVRAGIIERVLTTISPDVFLVDHEPLGVGQELLPVLHMLRESRKTTAVLGLRDILDDPAQIASRWLSTGTNELVGELYDRILIYGNQQFYDTRLHYQLDAMIPGRSSYCGVVTAAQRQKRVQTNKPPQHIVVSGGGGRDAFPLYDATLTAYQNLKPSSRPALTLVAGPLMDTELCVIVRERSVSLGVDFRESVSDYPSLLKQADLMISMAGYNSTNECLVVGCPLLVSPRVGPSSEQRIRAERLENLNLGRVVYREDLLPERLQNIMTTPAPDPSPAILATLNFSGAENSAKQISQMMASAHLAYEPSSLGGSVNVATS